MKPLVKQDERSARFNSPYSPSLRTESREPKPLKSSLSFSLDKVAQINIADVSTPVFVEYVARQLKTSNNWSERREVKRALVIQLRKFGYVAVAEKLARCHAYVDVKLCETNHAFDVKVDYRCYLSFCPDCAREKSSRELARILPKFLQALRDDPRLIVALFTTTILSNKERSLRDGCKEVKSVFRKLRRQKLFKDCAGGVGRVENTYSKRWGWHPHSHSVLLLKNYIPQSALSDALEEITNGESKICDIRRVSDVADGLIECIKYPFKPADISKMGRKELGEILALKGERLGVTFGVLHGIEVEEETSDFQNFVEQTKELKHNDLCPICRTRIFLFRGVPRERYEEIAASVEKLYNRSRGHPDGH